MILKDQLYTIENRKEDNGNTIVTIAINPGCFIYKAHFPGNPITPGVCIVQTACELLGEIVGRKLEITKAKDIKFTNILSPTNTPKADFVFTSIEDNDGVAKAKVDVKNGDEIFTTISFTCK